MDKKIDLNLKIPDFLVFFLFVFFWLGGGADFGAVYFTVYMFIMVKTKTTAFLSFVQRIWLTHFSSFGLAVSFDQRECMCGKNLGLCKGFCTKYPVNSFELCTEHVNALTSRFSTERSKKDNFQNKPKS